MQSRELADLLFRKAAQDEFVLVKLIPDPASPDDVRDWAESVIRPERN